MKASRSVNILFTSVGRRVELLRAFRRSYGEQGLGGTIIGTDIDPLAPALREADRIYMVPPVSDPDYVPTVAEICRTERVDLVFPLIDPDVPVLARGRHRIEATGARVVALRMEGVKTTTDKYLTYEFFKELGVPTPATWLPAEARDAQLDYPVFVKQRCGSASRHAMRVDDRDELEFFLRYIPEPIVQEFVTGPEVTSDVLCDFEGTVRAVVCRQRIEVRSGEVAKGKTIFDPEIEKWCSVIAEGLAAIGPITVQCLMHDGNPFFTEVNPRFGGGIPLGISAGVDSPGWLLALAAGRPIEFPALGTYTTGLYLTRFDDSFLLTEDDRVNNQSNRL